MALLAADLWKIGVLKAKLNDHAGAKAALEKVLDLWTTRGHEHPNHPQKLAIAQTTAALRELEHRAAQNSLDAIESQRP